MLSCSFSFSNFFIFKKCFFRGNLYKNKILNLFYWNTVGLQCYINFCCTEKWFRFIYVQICIYSNIHTHTHTHTHIISFQFSSVAQLCPPLCDPMNRSTPGLPVHHQLPEFTQTHVHQVSDAIQPSHPLSSPAPPAPNPSQHQCLFQWVNSSHEVAKVLEFQLWHHSFQRNSGADLQNGQVGSPCSPRDSQESSPTPQFKGINSFALSFLHSPTLTSIHDHWKNHSLD